MSEKTVFISYRRDAAGKYFARSIEGTLTRRGYDVFLDVDCIDAGEWAKQILTEVPKRAHFLLLLTPGALDRCTDENDWVRQEFLLARERGRNIVPVREGSVDPVAMRAAAPEAVKAIFDFQIHTIRHGSFGSDIEALTTRYIPPHKAPKEGIPKSTAFQADISRIIKYAPAELIGREAETKLLTDAWDQAVRSEKRCPHVLTFVALGGEGKTSLVAKWAAELAHRDWPGCDAVFAWSFYSQGTREQTAVSSDAFLAEALGFFGDAAMAGSAQGAFDKGRRLARLVGERRALLILDGVEPLQYPPRSPMDGKLKDDGIIELLKGLAAMSLGLCVVTSRYAIADLRAYWQTNVLMHELPRFSTAAGMKLLRTIGVKTGSRADFEKLVEDVDGHALTLQILGQFLVRAFHGDIRRRDRISLDTGGSERAAQTLKWVEPQRDVPLLTIALDHLTLGRAALYAVVLESSSLDSCSASLQHAVDGLRRAGAQEFIVPGLLSRAWLRVLEGTRTGRESARSDLDEAWDIAERGPMKLHMADIHLYRARLFFREAKYPWGSPATDLAAAREARHAGRGGLELGGRGGKPRGQSPTLRPWGSRALRARQKPCVRGSEACPQGSKSCVQGRKPCSRGSEACAQGSRALRARQKALLTRLRGLPARLGALQARQKALLTKFRGLPARQKALRTRFRGFPARLGALRARKKTFARGSGDRAQGSELCAQGIEPCGRSSEPRSRGFRPRRGGARRRY